MSREIRGFQVEELGINFSDDFNNSSIHSNWDQDDPNESSTFTEDSTDLTISNPGGDPLEWLRNGEYLAPNVNMAIMPYNFTAKVFISGIEIESDSAGSLVHYEDGVKSNYHSIGIFNDGTGDYYILTHTTNFGPDTEIINTGAGASNGGWVAIMRRGSYIHTLYSLNTITNEPDINDMNLAIAYVEAFPYNDNRIALVAETKFYCPAIAIEFRKFRLTYP